MLRHTASKLSILLSLFFLMPAVMGADPLPPELEENYQKFREVAMPELESFMDMRSYSLEDITLLMKEMSYHDAGILNATNSEMENRYGIDATNSTKVAAEYLKREVIDPLKTTRSVTLETGEVIAFEDLSEAALLELLFYQVRDNIKMAGPEDVPESERWQANIPGLKNFVVSEEKIVQFPCETVFLGRGGICYDKALLLGTLLKMEGYDVAYGYYASWVLNIGPFGSIRMPGYHSYVIVKDEGWGIGDWVIEGARDMNGKEMDGKWIVLDPLYSPSFAPKMQMIGEHKPVKFAETPPWAKILIEEQGGKVLPSELVFRI